MSNPDTHDAAAPASPSEPASTPLTTGAPPQPTKGQAGTALIVVAGIACLVVALQQTLVVPAVPQFPQLLNTTASAVSWMVTATLLTGAIATPIIGRLADLFGKRRMMVLAMSFVLVGSLLAPLGGIGMVIVGRALQGMGTALVPVAMAQMRDSIGPKRVGSALAILSATLGVGGGIGIPLGGQILAHLGWEWMFWASALLSVLSIVLILRYVPVSHADDRGSVDVPGAIGLSLGLLALLLGISQGGSWGWTDIKTLGALAVGVLVLIGWGAYELRHSSPIVDLRVNGTRALLFTNLASLLLGVLMFANLLATTIQLQNPAEHGGFGWDAAAAGLAMLPNAAAMFIVAPISARLAERFGPRVVLEISAVVTGLGYLSRAFLSLSGGWTIVWATLIGIGVGIGYAALPMLVVKHAPLREMGSANGVNALMRAIGTAIASAVIATISTGMSVPFGDATVPSQAALLTMALFGVVLSALTYVMATLARSGSAEDEGAK